MKVQNNTQNPTTYTRSERSKYFRDAQRRAEYMGDMYTSSALDFFSELNTRSERSGDFCLRLESF